MSFITNLLAKLNGLKTYIIGVAAILTALGAFLNGALDTKGLVEAVYAAITAMTLRHAITTTAGK